MGMMKYLARVGSVGGTARWAADTYMFFRLQHPTSSEWTESAIFRLMIERRYQVLPNPAIEQHLLGINYDGKGLFGLVVEILNCEAELANNTYEYQKMMMSVVIEELHKKGVSEDIIFGRGGY